MFKKTRTIEIPSVLYWLFVIWLSLNVVEWTLRAVLKILTLFV